MSPRYRSVAELDTLFSPNRQFHPSPLDWRDQFIYFLLVDRFDDGNGNPPPYQAGGPHGRDVTQGRRFQGGNLKGVTRRLDYIKELGSNAIWLSPILKNRDQPGSYHGYGTQDFLQVDPHFGTLADLQELTREAHTRGMYVILDIVLNHAGDVFTYGDGLPCYDGSTHPFGHWIEEDPTPGLQANDAVWPEELQHEESFKRKGKICRWENRDEAKNGDFETLKELNLPNPGVLDTLIKVYKYWITAADLDGFRVDTVKHMENSAMAIFCNAIREYAQRIGKHNFFMFGEIAGNDELIQQYLGRNARIEGTSERFPSLDASLDFPLYYQLESVIKGFTNPAALRERYDALHNNYADHGAAGAYFVTFADNHDRNQRFLHNDPYPQQALLAVGYLLTCQGVPCIYYGTEQGFDSGGGDDSYVRECMFGGQWGAFDTTGQHFFNPAAPLYSGIADVATVRAAQPALRYGRQYFREISGNGRDFGHPLDGRCTLAYSRILDTEEVLVALNLDSSGRNDCITVDHRLSAPGRTMSDLLTGKRYMVETTDGRAFVRVGLPAHSMAILKVQ